MFCFKFCLCRKVDFFFLFLSLVGMQNKCASGLIHILRCCHFYLSFVCFQFSKAWVSSLQLSAVSWRNELVSLVIWRVWDLISWSVDFIMLFNMSLHHALQYESWLQNAVLPVLVLPLAHLVCLVHERSTLETMKHLVKFMLVRSSHK